MRRLLPVAAATALLALAGAAVQARQSAPPVKTTTSRCGAYTVKLQENGFDEPEDRVTLVGPRGPAVTLSDVAVEVQLCRDVTGDGVPEVLLMGFSGGAHCCAVHELYSLTVPPRRLLRADSAHSTELTFRQLDGGGPLEIVGSDWRFAYAYGLSFADSPALSVVYRLRGGRYVDDSRRFPGVVRATYPRQGEPSPGDYLYDLGTRVAVGRPDEAGAYLEKVPAGPRAWLEGYLPDIRADLGTYGMSDWPERAGVPEDAPRATVGGSFSAPGRRELAGLVGDPRAKTAALRLLAPEGDAVRGSAPLRVLPGANFTDAAWLPRFAVRRATGRDDLVVRDARSGSVKYAALRLSAAGAVDLTGDALSAALPLLGALETSAARAGDLDERGAKATAALRSTLAERADAARRAAEPWNALGEAPFDLAALTSFRVGALELREDGPNAARLTATADLVLGRGPTSEWGRAVLTATLERREGRWAVVTWTRAAVPGSPPLP